MKRTPVIGIDLIRFLAATLVVLWHFAGKPFLDPSGATIQPLMPPAPPEIPAGVEFSWVGWLGVQIFFVISGVVIAYSADGATARSFFTGRFARLWPAMFVCATIGSLSSLIFWHVPATTQLARYAGSLLFSPVGPWFAGQVWTLPIEIAFYAMVWALIALGRTRWIEGLAWLLGLASCAYWIFRSVNGAAPPGNGAMQLLVTPHGCYFAIGILLEKVTADRITMPRAALLLVCIATAGLEIGARAAAEVGASPYAYHAAIPFALWLAATVAIWASMYWRELLFRRGGRFAGLFRQLGLITYPLYLVHYHVGGPVFAAFYRSGASVWTAFLPAYAVALLAAFLIAHWIEPAIRRPLSAALEGLLDRRRQYASDATTVPVPSRDA